MGCQKQRTDTPFWDDVKLSDLKDPTTPPDLGVASPIPGINLEVYCYEVPVDELKTLQPVWNPLSKQRIRFKNALSFQGNGFQFSRTKLDKLTWISGNLEQAKAVKLNMISLILTEDYHTDLVVTPLPSRRPVSFLNLKGDTESTTIGPGDLNLRFHAEKGAGSPYANQILVYPMATVPTYKGIEKFEELANQLSAAFMSTSLTAPVSPGDVFLLGPDEFYGDISTLGGLFFLNPGGRTFTDPENGERSMKRTVRVYVILCTSVQ